MKKLLSMMLTGCLLVCFADGAGASRDLSSLQVALVVANPSALDSNKDIPLKDYLENSIGCAVTPKDDGDYGWDPVSYDVVIISESASSSNAGWLKTEEIGILSVEGCNYDEFEMAGGGNSEAAPDTDVIIKVGLHGHYITEGYGRNEIVTVASAASHLGYMQWYYYGMRSLAGYRSYPERSWLLVVEKGDLLKNGSNTAAERRVFLGAQYFGNLTDAGKEIFTRALAWAAYADVSGGGDTGIAVNVPRIMSFQGKLKDTEGVPLEGSFTLTFRLYDTETESAPIWEETQEAAVQSGVLDIELGSVTPLDIPFDKQYWLGVTIGSDDEMAPRFKLSTVPYSFSSGN